MNLELEAYEGELRKLRRLNEIIKHEVLAEKLGDIYFICGEGGIKDLNGLPDKLMICPAYGVDWFQVYQKTDVISGTEW
jgi:hypothetical protein